MNLLERWNLNGFNQEQILSEINFLINGTHNGYEFFCTDENNQKIQYCVPYEEDIVHGQRAGICYSQDVAIDAIKYILNEYSYLFLSWLKQGEDEINFCIKLKTPIAYILGENNEQEEVFSTMFVLSKCDNKAGFKIAYVVPLLGYVTEEE